MRRHKDKMFISQITELQDYEENTDIIPGINKQIFK